jgi:hypothetical protein
MSTQAAPNAFEQICDALALIGLSRVIAAPVVTHACKVAGLVPELLRREDVAVLGPVLERSLRMYLGEEQVALSLRRVHALSLSGARPTTRDTLHAVAATVRARPGEPGKAE